MRRSTRGLPITRWVTHHLPGRPWCQKTMDTRRRSCQRAPSWPSPPRRGLREQPVGAHAECEAGRKQRLTNPRTKTVRPQCCLAGHCREGAPESRVDGGAAKAGPPLRLCPQLRTSPRVGLATVPRRLHGSPLSGVRPEWGFCALMFWRPNFSNPK